MISLPLLIEWNEARKQFDVKWLFDKDIHLQEFNPDDTHKFLFNCKFVDQLAAALGVKKDGKQYPIIAQFRSMSQMRNENDADQGSAGKISKEGLL